MRVNEADEGPGATSWLWGATTGPQGALSESLSMGLGLKISLGPADGDLLTEPTFSQGGVYTPTIQKNVNKNKNYNIIIIQNNN